MILSVAMMFKYTFENQSLYELINKAVNSVLSKGYRTKDISSKGTKQVSTFEMGDLVLKELSNEKFNIAVVGATGNVGREILNILDSRKFPVNKIYALASSKSEGMKISYGNDNEVTVQSLDKFKFKDIDLVLSSPGSKVSEKFVPKATKDGAIVIDNTSLFRLKKDIPLIIPEVNPDDISNLKKKIIANPNCSTIQMLVALNRLKIFLK